MSSSPERMATPEASTVSTLGDAASNTNGTKSTTMPALQTPEESTNPLTTSTGAVRPTVLTDELRMLGFRSIPTVEEARELREVYANPILTSDQVFKLWCDRNLPAYQNHRGARKRPANHELTRPYKKRTDENLLERTVADGGNEDQGEDEEDPPEKFNSIHEAYRAAIAKESVPDCYTVIQYENSYKRAYEIIAMPHRAAWKTLVSPVLDEKHARELANKNGRDAVEEYGGYGPVMLLAIRTDKQHAANRNLTVPEWLAQPLKARKESKMAVPEGYNSEQWKASVKRARTGIYNPIYRGWVNVIAGEATAKKEQSEKARKAVEAVGADGIKEKALADDLEKAEASGMTLKEWLQKWSSDLERQRAKTAALKQGTKK